MTRRDYEVIASSLYESKPNELTDPIGYDRWDYIVSVIAEHLNNTYDNFDIVKFAKACDNG